MRNDLRIVGANLCTLQIGPDPAGRLPEGALAISEGRISWVGPQDAVPEAKRTIDARGRVVTPGWIDCHTHLVFAGERAFDYRRRSEGLSYREIAEAGGGIHSTVKATRAASEDALVELARPRLRRLLERGITTVEAKSGYGLDTESELKILRVMRRLSGETPVEVVSTFLGAHAVPPGTTRPAYVDRVVQEMLPAVAEAKLARFCDVWVEAGFFEASDARRILGRGRELGLLPKLHADQLSSGGGAELAAELGCVSADHLEHSSDAGIEALARAGTVAVLLPGAAMFLGDAPPRLERFRSAGVTVALSTDLNPGTSPTDDLALMTTLACSGMGFTVFEALQAVTCGAARAIARDDLGVLAPGKTADVVIWDAPSTEHLSWHFGLSHAALVIKRGEVVLERDAAPECRP